MNNGKAAILGMAALSAMVAVPTVAQSQSPSPQQLLLPPSVVRGYLRQPGGIEKLSARVGDVVLHSDEEAWGEETLSSLASRSDLIVAATIISCTSHLTTDGDSIESSCTLQPQENFKGSVPADARLFAEGGTVTLSNGHHATVHTFFDGAQEGQLYLLFLSNHTGSLTLASGSQSMLHINSVSDRAEFLTGASASNSQLAQHLAQSSAETIENEVHNAVASH